MANYDYVADSSFRPFSMQEMLTPLMLYKDAYDKQKAAYDELEKGADVYSYLGEVLKNSPESKAAKMYNDFANELNKANDDFSKNGLSISNSRSLVGLKRQYNRDIRRIEKADEKLQELNKQRRALAAAGKPMLYANDNPTIDDMLEDSDFNDYSINGDDLYAKGINTGKSFSARLFDAKDEGSTLKGYYRKWVESQGYDPDALNEFQEEMLKNDFREVAASIPELRRAIVSNLEANGVYDNLTGKSLRMAEQQYLNGVIDGAIYKKDEKLVKDESKMSAAQMASNALGWANLRANNILHGVVEDKDAPGKFKYDVRQDPSKMSSLWMYDIDDKTGEIKGYSEEYKKLAKSGMINKNGNINTTTTTTSSSGSGTTKIPLLADMKYSTDTKAYAPVGNKDASYGDKITKEKAAELAPDLVAETGEYADYYDYYITGKTVYRIGRKTTTTTGYGGESVVTPNGDDEY